MTENQVIPNITINELYTPDILNSIYNDIDINYYWSEEWSTELYAELAYAGFITTSMNHPEMGAILLPEMQLSYAVLDWEHLHISQKIKRFLRSEGSNYLGMYLRITKDVSSLCENLNTLHGKNSWLLPEYQSLIEKFPTEIPSFEILGIELWGKSTLLAGEIGYTIGATYTSLTGFSDRENRLYKNVGSLQMVQLAKLLEKCGYDFWNLGHPYMDYKSKLGAVTTDRIPFLRRWYTSRENEPTTTLSSLIGTKIDLLK